MSSFNLPCKVARICLLLPLFFAGCKSDPPLNQSKRSRPVMGTFAEVTALAPTETLADQAVQAAYDALDTVNRLMSDYTDDSEVGRLNRLGQGEALVVSEETFAVLKAAAWYAEASEGAIDITCRPLVQLWKRAGRDGVLPTEAAIAEARSLVDWRGVLLDESKRTVALAREGMQIDLGAIAKGYALDLAARAMKESGAVSGLVNVGGDVLAFGHRDGKSLPWNVGIRHPFDAGAVWGKLSVTNGAVATSGDQERFSVIDGTKYSHIIDPRTGLPARQTASVTVVAPDGLSADAWATVFSVLSVSEGKALAERQVGVESLWLWGSGDQIESERTSGFDRLPSN